MLKPIPTKHYVKCPKWQCPPDQNSKTFFLSAFDVPAIAGSIELLKTLEKQVLTLRVVMPLWTSPLPSIPFHTGGGQAWLLKFNCYMFNAIIFTFKLVNIKQIVHPKNMCVSLCVCMINKQINISECNIRVQSIIKPRKEVQIHNQSLVLPQLPMTHTQRTPQRACAQRHCKCHHGPAGEEVE